LFDCSKERDNPGAIASVRDTSRDLRRTRLHQYSTSINRPMPIEKLGWVTLFHELLQQRLADHFGAAVISTEMLLGPEALLRKL
jgi:hypothetical protein